MENSQFLTTVAFPLVLAFIMMGMGMSLGLRDFTRVIALPRAVALGAVLQLVLLPGLAFAIATALALPPEVALGLMLIAASPGGSVSNLISFLARANVALSVTLTAISALVTILTIPLIINHSLQYFMAAEGAIRLSFWDTLGRLSLLTAFPIGLGMLVRWKYPEFAAASLRWFNRLAAIFLVVLIAGIAFAERDQLVTALVEAGPAVFLLNSVAAMLGVFSAKALALNERDAITLGIETGFQNPTIAIFIAISLLEMPQVAVVPAVYGLVMYVSAFVLVWRARCTEGRARRQGGTEAEKPHRFGWLATCANRTSSQRS